MKNGVDQTVKNVKMKKSKKSEKAKSYVVLTGNLSEGFDSFGPYQSIEEAFLGHDGDDCWIMVLNDPVILSEPATMKPETSLGNTIDMFNYQTHWTPEAIAKRKNEKEGK